jgi:hypothetical protein
VVLVVVAVVIVFFDFGQMLTPFTAPMTKRLPGLSPLDLGAYIVLESWWKRNLSFLEPNELLATLHDAPQLVKRESLGIICR